MELFALISEPIPGPYSHFFLALYCVCWTYSIHQSHYYNLGTMEELRLQDNLALTLHVVL